MSIKEKKILLNDLDKGTGLKKVVKMKPEEVVNVVKESELKGRGGAGFPTGLKWSFTAAEKNDVKYVVCNADEGEPGTFKDRELLTKYTAKLLEGMAIAGYAIGSSEGYIYLRGEYAFMRTDIEKLIETMKKDKLLGDNILDSGFNFDIKIKMGAGAYVCGEEFALIESMNGQRGEPRNKPPFPAQQGYLEKPTLINNVETYCYIPHIVDKGARWFSGMGVEGSKGTKLFSVSGDVEKPGVYEFEMGITVNELLEFVGGKGAKSVQVGGFSGMNVAEKDFDQKIAFGALPPGGSIIVFGPETDMYKVLINMMEFFEEESCGQCTPCREGNYQILKGLKMVREGKAPVRYLKELLSLSEIMKDSSKCGLGQSSTNSFVTIMENFKSEILFK